ncbi:MAG TPA: hypothetical protein VHB74_14495 [Devosia sp.]|nr:hypothetical protein [Devosia sp.]
MMFLVRSAFWLTVAFVAFHPHDVDLGATASALSNRAVDAGRQIVAQQILEKQILPTDCALLRCAPAAAAPHAATASLQNQPAGRPMQDSPVSGSVPFPRPRPSWLG